MKFVATLVLMALLSVLSGCGHEPVIATDDPTPGPTSEPTSSPEGDPTWPSSGCDEHSGMSIDYVSDAAGAETREEAAASYMEPGDRFVRQAPQPEHRARGWLVVTPANEIRAVIGLWNNGNGWLVESVEQCSG